MMLCVSVAVLCLFEVDVCLSVNLWLSLVTVLLVVMSLCGYVVFVCVAL